LLVVGTEDPRFYGVKRAAELIPKAEFHTLSGIDHFGSWARLDLIQPLLSTFLDRNPIA
jgi:pimeloyl-ACP methyl ester carboxylesterase